MKYSKILRSINVHLFIILPTPIAIQSRDSRDSPFRDAIFQHSEPNVPLPLAMLFFQKPWQLKNDEKCVTWIQSHLVGGWALPLWKICSSVGMMTFPTEWKNTIHIPNHQSAMFHVVIFVLCALCALTLQQPDSHSFCYTWPTYRWFACQRWWFPIAMLNFRRLCECLLDSLDLISVSYLRRLRCGR